MTGILLSGVGYFIFWIFKYDDWNPNPLTDSDQHSRAVDPGDEELGSRTE